MSRLRILSLGAGVQSSTLALMSARGDLPGLDCAIFADTGWEPRRVYEWLDWLEAQLPFPVIRAQRPGMDLGEIAQAAAAGEVQHSGTPLPPWYTADPFGMLMKQCSKEFKTRVVGRVVREMLGLAPGQRGPKDIVVEQWLGISYDEMHRMKMAEQPFVENVFPLVDRVIRRRDCLRWMAERQYPTPPKSSCIFCPYRGNDQWREMRDTAPADWRRACEFDEAIRPGFFGMKGEAYVHRQRVPLTQVDLRTDLDFGQASLFADECDGVCGV